MGSPEPLILRSQTMASRWCITVFAYEESGDVALTNDGKILTLTRVGSDFANNFMERFFPMAFPILPLASMAF